MIAAHDLKALLPDYLRAIGCEVKQVRNQLQCKCPLHADSEPSFEADMKAGGWVWHCFPCGMGGSVLDLHAALQGMDARREFREVCKGVASILGGSVEAVASAARSRVLLPAGSLADDDEDKSIAADELVRLTTPWRETLASGRATLGLLLEFREMGRETLKALALPALDALGVVPAGHTMKAKSGRNCVLDAPRWGYVGDGGYCVRSPFGRGVEPRFWRVGKLRRPWRSHRLQEPAVCVVHLVESETDAMALIAAGFESESSAVVAVPGASGFRSEWAELFKGREVHFWPDRDSAGMKFVERVAAMLQGKAARMLVHEINDLKEVAA